MHKEPLARSTRQTKAKKRKIVLGLLLSLMIVYATLFTQVRSAAEGAVSERVAKLFVLREVAWSQADDNALLSKYVTEDLLWKASGLKLGTSMLEIHLEDLQAKLRKIAWIQDIHIQKKLPGTLVVEYSLYEPRALMTKKNQLWFVDADGKAIGQVPGAEYGYPVISAPEALASLEAIETYLGEDIAKIHEVAVKEKSSTALVSLAGTRGEHKTWLRFARGDGELSRMKKVIQYLIKNNILVKSIDSRFGKKVVVNAGEDS